jgi:sulfide:quinone oxidoreductase
VAVRKPNKLRVVIAGGGVAALEATLALRALAEERVAIQLIAPEPHFWYRPLSVLEPFGVGHVRPLELAQLARSAGADFDLGALASVDTDARVARTAAGAEYDYDALVIACGAQPREALAGAFTFRGPADSEAFGRLLEDFESGAGAHLVFAVPAGATWPLPLYELALLSAAHLAARSADGVELALVTPEGLPLALFGPGASGMIAELLGQNGIAVHTGRYPVSVDKGVLRLSPSETIAADRVVTLPRLDGPAIPGIRHTSSGFVRTDASGLVAGCTDVYAAGDATAFPVMQGGLAAQQADAVAEAIAARAGAPVTPKPFRPILRGLLLTGQADRYLRAEIAGGSGSSSIVDTQPLWWPPGKIVGRYLAPFLAEKADVILTPPADEHAVRVAVDLAGSTVMGTR